MSTKCHVVAVQNAKGGIGKTTTVINLAERLHDLGRRVLMVDVDTQANLTGYFQVETDRVATVTDLYRMDELPTKELVKEAVVDLGFADLLRGDQTLVRVENLAATIASADKRIAYSLAFVKDDYDFVLIDCPAFHGTLTLGALVAADYLIVPFDPSPMALEGYVGQMDEMLRKVRANPFYNPDLKVLGLLLTLYDGRRVVSRSAAEVLQGFADATGTVFFDTKVRTNVAATAAASMHVPVAEYDPSCHAAEDYSALAREIVARIDELESTRAA